jgi:hypothetical protein
LFPGTFFSLQPRIVESLQQAQQQRQQQQTRWLSKCQSQTQSMAPPSEGAVAPGRSQMLGRWPKIWTQRFLGVNAFGKRQQRSAPTPTTHEMEMGFKEQMTFKKALTRWLL